MEYPKCPKHTPDAIKIYIGGLELFFANMSKSRPDASKIRPDASKISVYNDYLLPLVKEECKEEKQEIYKKKKDEYANLLNRIIDGEN